MNYAKKNSSFLLPCIFFSQGMLDKIRRLDKIYTLCAFIFFIFGHHIETSGLIPIISVTQLCRNRLEEVTSLSNTILLPTIVQVWVSRKIRKAEKEKAWITKNKKVTKKVVLENLQRDYYHAHSTSTFRIQSNI